MKLNRFTLGSSASTVYVRFILFLVLAISLLLSARSLHAAELKGTIKIGGTGSALGGFKELAEAFKKIHPDVNIVILPSLGSGGGIKAVNEGVLDIGLSGRPLKDSEQKQGVSAFEYARTPFVFATAEKTDGFNFTLQDVAGMFSGVTKIWPDGTPIRLVLRPEADIDTVIQKGMSSEMDKAVMKALSREGMIFAVTDQESADDMEKIHGAIGTSTLTLIISEKRALHTITLDGVAPKTENIANGSYKYYKPFYVVTGPKSAPPVLGLIEFINSGEGREILKKTGQSPI